MPCSAIHPIIILEQRNATYCRGEASKQTINREAETSKNMNTRAGVAQRAIEPIKAEHRSLGCVLGAMQALVVGYRDNYRNDSASVEDLSSGRGSCMRAQSDGPFPWNGPLSIGSNRTHDRPMC
jgi:hypothetical protein